MIGQEPTVTALYPGQRVFRWTVIDEVPRPTGRGRWRTRWHCRCDCGTEKNVLQQSLTLALTSPIGGSRSCGCLVVDVATKHGNASGAKPTSEYMAWISAKKRCTNPSNRSFNLYGARGIRMEPTWASSFEAFRRDMGPKPSSESSLDRIDSNGNYEPGNCRWAPPIVQARNKRNVHWYIFEDQRVILADVALQLGITRDQARILERRRKLPAWRIPGATCACPLPYGYMVDLNDVTLCDSSCQIGLMAGPVTVD